MVFALDIIKEKGNQEICHHAKISLALQLHLLLGHPKIRILLHYKIEFHICLDVS